MTRKSVEAYLPKYRSNLVRNLPEDQEKLLGYILKAQAKFAVEALLNFGPDAIAGSLARRAARVERAAAKTSGELLAGSERLIAPANAVQELALSPGGQMRRFGVGGGMEWSSTRGDILFRADALPGWNGLVVPRRLTTYEMELLSRTFGAEFSLQYVAGPGRNGGGGIYRLYSGTYRNVHVPTGPGVFWISSTAPLLFSQ